MPDQSNLTSLNLIAQEERAHHVDVTQLAQRIGALIDALLSHPDERVRASSEELLDALDALHREAFGRISVAIAGKNGLRESLAEDPVVRILFELYGILRTDEIAYAQDVLAEARRYIESHGGHLQLLDAHEGTVRVRLSGACHGCAGSAITLRRTVETALREGLPGFRDLVVDDEPEGRDFEMEPTGPQVVAQAPRFRDTLTLAQLPVQTLVPVTRDDCQIVLLRLGDEVYAYRDACLDSPLPLRGGVVKDGCIVCPWHGCLFEATSGKARPPATGTLQAFPVAVVEGVVQVATNVPACAS